MSKATQVIKKIWLFLWQDDSIWSWLANIVVAFVLIKFIVYPGLGFLFATTHPIVAVVSGSMEHQGDFDAFWEESGFWYEQKGITKEEFRDYWFHNGFNKGDIMILEGWGKEKLKKGDVIVFVQASREPIIHRLVGIRQEGNEKLFWTKGDNNPDSIKSLYVDETNIKESQIIGKAVVRVPYLGYIKIGFVELIKMIGG